MRHFAALLLLGFVPLLGRAQQPSTIAEKTEYKATSRYADVVAFCKEIAKRGPLARLEYFGTSHEGRQLPLLIVADPPVATVDEAKKAGKLVVLVFANIHAGEVDGKEAVLQLARELTEKMGHALLKDLAILLVPILNADGNEKFATTNRPGQNGPRETGTRANAQGLDLNRDFVKLESPEIRALVKLFNAWDPALVIDCHTTNGSKHRYTLTYDGPRYPSSSTPEAEWTNTTFFPTVTKKVKAATGFDIGPYGNFSRDRTKWETYPATPRYGVQYFALRGRIGILSESYTYASFKDRVTASKAFVAACLEVAAANRKELEKAIASARPKQVPIRTLTEAFPTKIGVLGFEETVKNGKRIASDKPKEYSLSYVGKVVPSESVTRPFAYLIPPSYQHAIETLHRHGIVVEELREDSDLDIEAFAITSVDAREGGFPKRVTNTEVAGKWRPSKRHVPAGTLIVKCDDRSLLASYLLEPRCEDGLTTWSMFNDGLAPGKDHPVLRVPKPFPLTPKLKVGDPPPPLKATKWLAGQEVKSFEKGKVYVVEFWATWCGPCVVMMPHMGDIQEELGPKGITVIGFTAKDPGNTAERVAQFVAKRGSKLGYTIAYADDRDTYDAYMTASGHGGIPCSFVIGKDGRIAFIGHPLFLDEVLPKVLDGTWDPVKGAAELEAADKLWDATFAVMMKPGDPVKQLAEWEAFSAKWPRLAADPYMTGARLKLLVAAKRFAEARKLAESVAAKAMKRNDTAALDSVADAVSADVAAGQADLAKIGLRVAESALAINGETPAALIRMTKACAAVGDAARAKGFGAKAVAAAEKAVRGNTDAIGTLQVAAAYMASGDKAKAKAAAERAIDMAEKNPGLKQYVEEQAKKYGVEAKGEKKEK